MQRFKKPLCQDQDQPEAFVNWLHTLALFMSAPIPARSLPKLAKYLAFVSKFMHNPKLSFYNAIHIPLVGIP